LSVSIFNMKSRAALLRAMLRCKRHDEYAIDAAAAAIIKVPMGGQPGPFLVGGKGCQIIPHSVSRPALHSHPLSDRVLYSIAHQLCPQGRLRELPVGQIEPIRPLVPDDALQPCPARLADMPADHIPVNERLLFLEMQMVMPAEAHDVAHVRVGHRVFAAVEMFSLEDELL
jgi:hypothetical protein